MTVEKQDKWAIVGAKARERLNSSGALDIQRSVKIKGEKISCVEGVNPTNPIAGQTRKIIHFQRHGQGTHNEALDTWMRENKFVIDWDSLDSSKNPLVGEEFVDAPLTELGRQQCLERQIDCSLLNPEIIIVSPLLRAIQSAELSWATIPSHNWDRIPWVAHEGCRESIGLLRCNKRRPLSETKRLYPCVDFSLVPTEHDSLFMENRQETDLEKADRVYEFLLYLKELPQREIAVVCHSAWLFNMCNAVVDCGGDDSLISWFATAEVRSMCLTFIDSDEHQ